MPTDKFTDLERFFAKVEVQGTCWIWVGGVLKHRGNYGQFNVGGKIYRSHRWLYQQLVRKLRKAEYLDHLCLVTRCVNPDHLEVVSSKENTRRARAQWEAGMRLRWSIQ